MKTAFITGITGQDGSYLAELLLSKGYAVHGLVRRSSSFNRGRIEHLFSPEALFESKTQENIQLHYGDLLDGSSLRKILERVNPDEIYHLGAQSHVKISFDMPDFTGEATGMSTLRLLEAIRDTRIKTRFYQAGSSEMFGKVAEIPQRETTPFLPRSPYANAKLFAHWTAVNYREAYGMYIANGILFNHESPRRSENFVTRKITLGVAGIKLGLQKHLFLGNLEAKRDWGYAKDYVEAMYLMLQQPEPDDYVIATGVSYSVRDFCEMAFSHVGLDYREFVLVDRRYLRPTEVDVLLGDASKAARKLGWKPKTSLEELVKLMVDSDLELMRKQLR